MPSDVAKYVFTIINIRKVTEVNALTISVAVTTNYSEYDVNRWEKFHDNTTIFSNTHMFTLSSKIKGAEKENLTLSDKLEAKRWNFIVK